ncbi:MAG: peptidylprolyl isomerase [Microcoleaceae cyanobacterium]
MENLPLLPGSATVILVVNGSIIEVFVDGTNAPITAGNFVDLVEKEVYDGVSFHRVVREPQPFVVQGGDPQSKDPNVSQESLGTGGFVDPTTGERRNIPLEITPVGASEPIYSQTLDEAGITAPPLLRNTRGSIAMARANDLDSASSQFYFNLVDNDFLDGAYAVFGSVTQGLEVIDQIQQGDRILDAEVVDGIIPGRSSVIVTDTVELNQAINSMNLASLPLAFLTVEEFDSDNTIVISPDVALQFTGGIFLGGGNDLVTGSAEKDFIIGNGGNDTISGGGGNDIIRGDADDDVIDGGDGDDMLHGNQGNDQVSGGAGNDWIRGGQGNDNLMGDDGNDILIGDLGTDQLTGGTGTDTFLLRVDESAGVQDAALADTILDFNLAEGDRIGIIGEVDITTIQFQAEGSNVIIQNSNGDILGLVENAQLTEVQAAVFVTPSADLALTLG